MWFNRPIDRPIDRIYYVAGHGCSEDRFFYRSKVKKYYIEKFKEMGFASENIFVKCIPDISTASNIAYLYLNKSRKSISPENPESPETTSMKRTTKRYKPYKNTNLPEQLQIAYPKLNRMVARILEDVENKNYRNIFIVGHSSGGAFVNRIAERLNKVVTPEISSKIQMATFGSIWFWECPIAEKRVQLYNYVSSTDISQLCSGSVCHNGKPEHNCIFKYNSSQPLCDCYFPNIENDKSIVNICLYHSDDNVTYNRICDNKHRLLEHNSYNDLMFYLLMYRRINIYDDTYESNRVILLGSSGGVKNKKISKKTKKSSVSKSSLQKSSRSKSKTSTQITL